MKTGDGTQPGRGPLFGAMFLMAMSAIGPGFITQTTQFTAQLGAAFAFAIVVSVLVDTALQLNEWRVIGVSGLRAQELGNRILPGLGHAIAVIVALGGLVSNVGNVAGAGLGLDALTGLPLSDSQLRSSLQEWLSRSSRSRAFRISIQAASSLPSGG